LLIRKIDAFTRKYYLNRVIRGLLWFSGLLLTLYILFSVAEYYLYLGIWPRRIIFYGYLLLSAGTLTAWVVLPLLRYFRLGKMISREKAAIMIGRHFPEVADRLLNVLQLKELEDTSDNRELIRASIEQKTRNLQLIPFTRAINLKKNRKYLKYALPPVALLLLLIISAPNLLRESNYRLVHNSTAFEPPAPFQIIILNHKLETPQFEDFVLQVKTEGRVMPEQLYAISGNHRFRFQQTAPGEFSYTFRKPNEDIRFTLSANSVQSGPYVLHVLPRPVIARFKAYLDFPGYTGRKDITLDNEGDFVVPAGTRIRWMFNTQQTESIFLRIGDKRIQAKNLQENLFIADTFLTESARYTVLFNNSYVQVPDSISYTVTVVPDLYPEVRVTQIVDSTDRAYVFFMGEATDDYGFTQMGFFYRLQRTGLATLDKYQFARVPASFSGRSLNFNYTFFVDSLGLLPGDKLSYYFAVWDNDGVHGPKMSKTPLMSFSLPTEDEIKQQLNRENQEVRNTFEQKLKEAREINQEIEKLQERLLNKEKLSWEDRQALENLLQKNQSLQEDIKQLQNKMNEAFRQQDKLNPLSEEFLEKQKKLQDLLDQLLSDELKEKLEELQRLMEELDPDELMKELQDISLDNDLLEKELDKALELFKELEFQQNLENVLNEVEELAEEQDSLAEETSNRSADNEKLAEEQEALNKEFEKIQKDLDRLEELNKNLQNQHPFPETDQQEQEISQDMQEGLQQLQQGKKKKASGSQKNASKKMRQMQQQLSSMMAQGEMDQIRIDMESTRQLLENLIKLSKDQEAILDKLGETPPNSPAYKHLMEDQQKIRRDTRMVADSLQSLGKRVFQLSNFVNRELKELNKNLNQSIDRLSAHNLPQARQAQQYAMMHYNNLALMLDEVLQALQQQMSGMMPGSQMCQKPSQGPSLKDLGEMQKQLNQQLEEMKKQLQSGGQQGRSQKMSRGLAELAARQAAIRKALEQYNKDNEKGKEGNNGQLEEIAKEMDKSEKDIVNKQITNELLKRQQDILVRLLEAEKAERQQEESPERESQTARETTRELPPEIEEYLKKREAMLELYKTTPPALKPFYKNVVENYFRNIQ